LHFEEGGQWKNSISAYGRIRDGQEEGYSFIVDHLAEEEERFNYSIHNNPLSRFIDELRRTFDLYCDGAIDDYLFNAFLERQYQMNNRELPFRVMGWHSEIEKEGEPNAPQE